MSDHDEDAGDPPAPQNHPVQHENAGDPSALQNPPAQQNPPHINQAAAPQQQGMAVNLPPPIQISSPPPLKSTSPEDWNMFKVMWENYAVITQINRQAPDYRKAAFLHVIGPKGLQMYNNITYNQGEDKNDVTLIIEKLENLIVGQTNVIMSDMSLITEIREMMRT